MKPFLKYQELNEALKLSQYRDYHEIRPEDLENKLSEIFKGKNRIYIPFEYKVTDEDIDENINIRYVLDESGYTVTNYLEGYCEKDGRTFRIGKVLNKLNRLDLLKTFNEDPQRAIQNKNFLICISKHPYDIAGMSTDRGWTSCMNLETGTLTRFMQKEITEGTIIAYLINEDDKNINHPYGRINIKPYNNKRNDIAWGLAKFCYGSLLDKKRKNNILSKNFKNEVSKWVKLNLNNRKNGVFKLNYNVYDEARPLIKIGNRKSKEYKIDDWDINPDNLIDGVYEGDICIISKNIKEFKGFEEEIGLDIKEVKGGLYFNHCQSLTSVSNLPEKINGSLIFSNCTSLTSVSNLPKEIGENLDFTFCASLTYVSNMPEYIGGFLDIGRTCPFFEGMSEDTLRNMYNIGPLNFKDMRKFSININDLKDGVYNGDIKVSDHEITEFRGFKEELGLDIKEVNGSISFEACKSLTSISNLPKKIGENLYIRRCKSLTSVSNLPEYVGETLSFYECTSLTSLSNFPEDIGWNLDFNGCTSLTSVSNLPENVGCFLSFSGCTSLKSLPNLPKYIRSYLSFYECESLTSIEKMPSLVKNSIYTKLCPFFEGMNEEQIREKYNISR